MRVHAQAGTAASPTATADFAADVVALEASIVVADGTSELEQRSSLPVTNSR